MGGLGGRWTYDLSGCEAVGIEVRLVEDVVCETSIVESLDMMVRVPSII